MQFGPDPAGRTDAAPPWRGLYRGARRLLALEVGDRDLIGVQSASLSRLIPIMYLLGIASSTILAASFHGSAPLPLSAGVSMVLSGICVIRLMAWRRGFPADRAPREVRRLPARTAVFSLAYSSWATVLLPYGDGFARTQAVLVVLVMIITSMFCLSNVRRAAMLGGAMAGSVLAIFLFLEGSRASLTMGAYIVVVIGAMMLVAELQNRDFRRNVEALKLAATAQQRSEVLAHENVRWRISIS